MRLVEDTNQILIESNIITMSFRDIEDSVVAYISLQQLVHEIDGKEIPDTSELEEELQSAIGPIQFLRANLTLLLWRQSQLLDWMEILERHYT